MKFGHLTSLSKNLSERLQQTFASMSSRRIYYVIDNANWSFRWDGHFITKGLEDQLGIQAQMTTNVRYLRKQIIHFGSRYAYLDGTFRRLHPSNDVFLTWFHGDPKDPEPLMRQLSHALLEATDHIQKMVVSCEISRLALRKFGIPENKIVTIPLGVDLTRFCPVTKPSRSRLRAELGIPQKAICIGSFQKDGVGWGEGQEPKLIKGPDVFLEVISNLFKKYRNLVILLTGPSRGYIKSGLKKLEVPFIHHFLDNYHDIVRYYQALDLYLITSRCEGGPKAILESWATGIPVVSTKVGMSADMIKHGENAMLAESEDVVGLSDGAIALIEDPILRDRCCRQALEEVKHYDWPLIAKQYYQQLYAPLLNSSI